MRLFSSSPGKSVLVRGPSGVPVALLGLCAALTAASCGSDDSKRRPSGRDDDSGADASSSGGRGTGGATGGRPASGGSAGAGTGGATGDGGAGTGGDASVGDGGDASVSPGDGGAADASPDALPPLECAAGTGDCDGVRDNGCEANLTNDAEHCGTCERSCASIGATCSQSACGAQTLFSNLPFGSDNSGARSWAFDGTAAYHLGFNSYVVRRFPTSGGASTTVWSASATGGTESLAFAGGNVIWAQRGAPPTMLSKAPTAEASTLPTVMFTPEYTPTFVTVQGANLYWMSGDYQSGDPGGYVYSRSLAAPSTDPGTRIVTTNQGNHGAVVGFTATTNALYWVTSSSTIPYELRTAPLAGGEGTAVPGGAIQAGFTTGHTTLRPVGDALYFAKNVGTAFTNGIYRFRVGDAAPVQLVAHEDVLSFVMDDEYFYFLVVNTTGVYRAPIAGGQGVVIASAYGSEIIGQDASALYLALPGCCTTTISKVLK